MKQQNHWIASTEHEEVYHAALQCQVAALSLTPRRSRGLRKACSVEGKKTGWCFASQQSCGKALNSGDPSSIGALSGFKSLALIVLFVTPQGENDTYPDWTRHRAEQSQLL